MNITKKLLSVITATLCAATASVCSISVSAEKTSAVLTDSNLAYVNVDEDEDGIYDFVRITGCESSAESVLIPKAINDLVVKEIDPMAFATAVSLISVDVNSQNTYFSADDGILFDENGSTLICYPSAKAATSYSIPKSVTTISDYAFSNCSKMATVTIPSSVTSIGDYAFYNCAALADITIPASVESLGAGAFVGTELLTYQLKNNMGPLYYADTWVIYADSTVDTVMTGANAIKTGTTGIAGGAFYDCDALTKIEIPSGVLYIGESAFQSCADLSSITIPTTVKTVGAYAFSACTSLVELSIPNSVTTIDMCAFLNCTKLAKINIPSNVKTIAESTFENCAALVEVNIPSTVEAIEKLAFYNCAKLNKVVINNKNCDIKDAPQTFSNSESAFTGTIWGHDASTAQSYAKTYNRFFEVLEGGSTSAISGDANGDGKLNVRDCAFIAAALAEGKGDTLPIAADYNEDGKKNVRDAAAIASFLASNKQ